MGERIVRHHDLEVYQKAMTAAMTVFEASKSFPKEETYALTDQLRRSSRSVCANLAEAWRKRRYAKAFVSRLSDAEAEAAESQTWVEFASRCGYLERSKAVDLYLQYDEILRMVVSMIHQPNDWLLPQAERYLREESPLYEANIPF